MTCVLVYLFIDQFHQDFEYLVVSFQFILALVFSLVPFILQNHHLFIHTHTHHDKIIGCKNEENENCLYEIMI